MSISREGLTLLKQFEGFRPRAIALPDGRWLIGYGHTRYARSSVGVSEEQAELLLRHDLAPVVGELNTKIFAPLSQNEFDALTLFAFNVGLESFRASGIIAHLNAGERLAAARQIGAWNTAVIDGNPMVVDALVRRRIAEQALFLRTPNEVRPATSHLVAPLQDTTTGLATEQRAAQSSSAAAPARVQAPETIRATDDASNVDAVPEASGPPKPPSTLRTRFHDLLRAKKAKDGKTIVELDASLHDATWAGPIVLLIGALIFLALATYGGIVLSEAVRAGIARPPYALAALFGGVVGAVACAIAALRLIAQLPRQSDGEETPNET